MGSYPVQINTYALRKIVMSKYKDITHEQLKSFSGEHLYYEIFMLYGVVDILKQKPDFDNEIILDALIESFVIHTQIILDFFYIPQMKPDDAKAIHFVKNVGTWKKEIPSYDRYFRRFNRRRSREVVHLTYSRLEVSKEDKPWDIQKTTQHIQKVVNLFIEHADPRRLHERVYALKRD